MRCAVKAGLVLLLAGVYGQAPTELPLNLIELPAGFSIALFTPQRVPSARQLTLSRGQSVAARGARIVYAGSTGSTVMPRAGVGTDTSTSPSLSSASMRNQTLQLSLADCQTTWEAAVLLACQAGGCLSKTIDRDADSQYQHCSTALCAGLSFGGPPGHRPERIGVDSPGPFRQAEWCGLA